MNLLSPPFLSLCRFYFLLPTTPRRSLLADLSYMCCYLSGNKLLELSVFFFSCSTLKCGGWREISDIGVLDWYERNRVTIYNSAYSW